LQALNQDKSITVNAADLASLASQNVRVLHVDDDAAFLQISKLVLQEMDNCFDVDWACSVDEAMAKLATNSYDVIVSDYEMPEKSGLVFLKKLREQGNRIPFVLFTGKGREEVAILALNLGADGYYNKQGSAETVYGELAHGLKMVTQRKKAKEALRISEAKFSKIFMNGPNAVSITRSSDGKIIDANDSVIELLGYNPKDVIGKTVFELGIWANPDERQGFVEELLEKGSVHDRDLVFRRKDGTLVDIIMSATIIEINGEQFLISSFVDVTKRKKAEMALLESEAKYHELVDSLPEIVFEIDRKGRIVFASRAAFELTGYSAEDFGNDFDATRLVAPEDVERARRNLERMFARKVRQSNEYMFLKKDGTRFSVLLTSIPVVKDNNIAGARGIVVDMTERKEAEDAVKRSELRFRSICENSFDAVLLTKPNGSILSANPAACSMFGMSEEEIIDAGQAGVIVNDERARLAIEERQTKGRAKAELTFIRKDGSNFEGEVSSSIFTDADGTIKTSMIIRDITERKNNEESLRKSEERYRELTNSLPEIVFELDFKGKLTFLNDQGFKIMGYSSEELGKGVDILQFVIPEQRKIVLDNMKKALARQQPDPYEYTIVKKDGTTFPALVMTTPIIFEKKVVGLRGTVLDITERESMEKKLGKALSTAELLNEKLSIVGGFVRHDVKNKLSAINGNVYLAKKQIGDNVATQKNLDQIKVSSDNIVRILDFAKTFELLGNEKLALMDVGAAFDKAVSLFTDLKGVKIVNDCTGFSVLADSMLTTMFHNLIDNSLKYGEKLAQIKAYTLNNADGSRSVVYEDDGVGIDAETKKHLFEKGFGKGTGLGLYLIKKATDVYGWNIEENGMKRHGARFVMTIPKTSEKGQIEHQVQS
jgi:PAS domain S-box-containing protein